MSPLSPSVAYFAARKRYLDVQAIEDVLLRMHAMHELNFEWGNCYKSLMEAAETNDPEVWFALGDACQMARGTSKDTVAAVRWYQRAAEAGHTKAMVSLGHCLQRSESVDDKKRAIEWYREAAEKGDPNGMIWLGFSYRDGTAVVANHEEAVSWFIKAVEAGDGHSMIHVGRMYARHLKSSAKAVEWFLKAAEAGFSESHVELGMLYDERKSEVYAPAEAVKWWLVVAKGNSSSVSRARLALARHYRDGIGTTRDTHAAKDCLQKIIQASSPKSAFYREASHLLKEMEVSFL